MKASVQFDPVGVIRYIDGVHFSNYLTDTVKLDIAQTYNTFCEHERLKQFTQRIQLVELADLQASNPRPDMRDNGEEPFALQVAQRLPSGKPACLIPTSNFFLSDSLTGRESTSEQVRLEAFDYPLSGSAMRRGNSEIRPEIGSNGR